MSVYDAITSDRVWVAAELGSNHGGHLTEALRLIDAAAEAGADAVKFQSFLASELVTPSSKDFALLKSLEMPRDWYPRLKQHADDLGVTFFSTATNATTMEWLEDVGVELYKIGSPNITHIPLIRAAAATGKPLIISTGMGGIAEVQEAVDAFAEGRLLDKDGELVIRYPAGPPLALLYCVSDYPASRVNLRTMQTLATMYPYPVGYSDHTLGIGTAIAAAALGARVIEKHMTMDKTQDGPDHHFALEPLEFAAMVRGIREAEGSLGSPAAFGTPNHEALRSLHWARDIAHRKVVVPEDVMIVRPNDGLHPRELGNVIGRGAHKGAKAGNPITKESLL